MFLSNHGLSGPSSLKIVFHVVPGIVCTQLLDFPAGAPGPK